MLCRLELLSISYLAFAVIYMVLLNCIFEGEIDFAWKYFYVWFVLLKMTTLLSWTVFN